LSCDAIGAHATQAKQREERATAAKSWLASIAVPARARPVLSRALEATARDGAAIAEALEELVTIGSAWLDEACLAELRAITAAPFVNSR
jgi:hypothetical protein